MKKTGFLSIIIALCLTSISIFCVIACAADEIEEGQLKKGIYLFRQENYDEALDEFHEIFSKDPGSSLAAYYLGLTYKRMQDYAEARKYLESSLELTPKIKGALIELIDLLYRINDFEAAKKWIAIAEEEGIRPAQAKFLKGLTLQKSSEFGEAVKAFEDAMDLDERLTQSANYQIGICYLKMKKFRYAREVFEDTFAMDPYSDIANYADRYIDALDKKLERTKPFHFNAKIGFEYDSNVVLKPSDSPFATTISEQEDTRQVYETGCDYTFRSDDDMFSLKTGYDLYISKHNDFGRYDLFGNSFQAQGNILLDNILVTFPVNFNHYIVSDKNYLASVSIGNINNFLISGSHLGQLGVIYKYDDFMRPTTISDDQRSGNEMIGTVAWFWFFAENKGFITGRYTFDRDWAKGDNWKFYGNKISAGVLIPIWDRMKISVNGEINFQDFDNSHSLFDMERKDQTRAISSLFTYEIIKNLEFQVRYTYIDTKSSLSIYEYDRHVVGSALEFKY